jgi:acyl-CoA synthetase (NDP forming)
MVGESDETRAAIKALLQPSSIAIAGASSDPGKLGSLPLAFLQKHGYAGAIYPVHPKLDEIGGLRCYRSIADVDGDVDLLVIAVPAARIIELLNGCRPGQVKSALVLSSGFAEIGGDGAALQRELRATARAKGMRFIGPNSVGVANLHDKVVPSISQVFDQAGLAAGEIGFVTQSGAVGTAITALAHAEEVGIGYFLSTGNEADLEFSDFCDYFAEDPRVGIIAGYVESIRDGDKFRAAARKAARAGKPIALIKVGASEAGGKAVQSHTGALAGSEAVYRAAFDELGVVRLQSIEELIDVLKAMSCPRRAARAAGQASSDSSTLLTNSGGRAAAARVAILSHSGGAGVLMADTCIAEGLDVAAPSKALADTLRKRLPPYASFGNPIDMTASVIFDPALMAGTVRDVVQSGEYDAVMLCVNLIWRQGAALADELASLTDGVDALVGVAWIAGKPEPLARLKRAGVAVFSDPVRCARAIAARLRWEAKRPDVAVEAPHVATGAVGADLTGYTAQEALLRRYGVDLAPSGLAGSCDEAKKIARAFGYPVAAKLVARNLAHKSELGGVRLDIDSDAALERACAALDAIPIAGREGILVQRMVKGGLEVFVGMKRDEVFGPVIVVGLGGIYVEILRETVMGLAPFDEAAAGRLIRGSKFFAILDGARGQPKRDVAALAKVVARVSTLAVAEPAVISLDLNPIVVGESGAQVVDFKFELGN